ncbi:hypothetical protein OAT18_00135 [Tenacibaculum sp.]|nr:hypothetical protein [Tenacibaculum sp.]
MKSNIKNLFILGILFFIYSCISNKELVRLKCNIKYPILDSLGYTVFPNLSAKKLGNDVFKKIVEKKELIKRCLMERVLDTTEAKTSIVDSFNYKNGDIAILLLPYISKTEIPLRELFIDEFKNELLEKNLESESLKSLHLAFFFSNEKEVNYKYRKRFYNKLKSYIYY